MSFNIYKIGYKKMALIIDFLFIIVVIKFSFILNRLLLLYLHI